MRKAAIFLFSWLVALTNAAGQGPGREVRPLNQSWDFFKGDIEKAAPSPSPAWQKVDLPHTWNNKDMQAGPDFYAGTAWYRKEVYLENELAGRRVFIRFEGVGQVADVYVNSRLVGSHKGSYSAFCFDITPAAKFGAANLISVRVNNEARPDVIPINHFLFGIFGGVYRPVSLIVTSRIAITPTDNGSPGIYIRQKEVNERFADISVAAKLQSDYRDRKQVTLRTSVYDRQGRAVALRVSEVTVPPTTMVKATQELHLRKPILWNGRKNPYLYRLTTEVIFGGQVLDSVTQQLGLRYFRIDPERGFILNGRSYRLYGVCRHQDRLDCGNALSEDQQRTDFDLIYEIGATSVRLAHYQQAEIAYSCCDRLGLVVWAEIPFVNEFSGRESENAKQQLLELIRQNYNHPSIFFWGLHNEVYARDEFDFPARLTRELHDIAKTEDPDRFDVSTSGTGDLSRAMNYHADLQAVNRYFGWYEGKAADLEGWILSTRRERPGTLFALSEYGAEANIQQQSEDLIMTFDPEKGQYFPENYQTYFHQVQWPIIKAHPFIWASYVWNMFDFAVPLWHRGGVAGRNMKGLVTYDRQTRKDAFYYYQANWSDKPVLHIAEKRVRQRTHPTIRMTVFSNLEAVELMVNGQALGPPARVGTEACLVWENVALKEGSNSVRAVGYRKGVKYEDEVIWILSGSHQLTSDSH